MKYPLEVWLLVAAIVGDWAIGRWHTWYMHKQGYACLSPCCTFPKLPKPQKNTEENKSAPEDFTNSQIRGDVDRQTRG